MAGKPGTAPHAVSFEISIPLCQNYARDGSTPFKLTLSAEQNPSTALLIKHRISLLAGLKHNDVSSKPMYAGTFPAIG